MRPLSTSNLQLAVWIARLGTFTAAAERMNTTQPAVSARVKELEETLGHQLFVRQGRGVELTPEGREFVQKAETVLKQIEELSSKSRIAGVVRLGTGTICLDLLARMSLELSKAMPLVSFDVDIERAGRLLDRLEARKLDVAMVSGPVDSHKFRARSLGYDRLLWVASPRLLGQRRHVPAPERLKGLPIWCVHHDSFYWGPASSDLRAQGADLNRVNSITNTMAIARVVVDGAGIGLVSESATRIELDEGRLLPVPGLPAYDAVQMLIVTAADNTSTIVEEVMAAAMAASQFGKNPM